MSVIKRKVVFNATILNNRLTGLGVYCKNVLSRIKDENIDNILYTNIYENIKKNSDKDVILDIKSKNKFKSIILRSYRLKNWIKINSKEDILHYSPTQHGVNVKGIKQIITIHDLMPLYFPKGRIHQYIYYKYILKRVINKSNLIITVSNNTKKDILKEYKIKEDKIKVIYNGFDKIMEPIDKNYSRKYIRNKYNVENYILMVGIHYNYKNLHRVIEAYDNNKDKLKYPIVIVGGFDCKYGHELKKLVSDKNLQDRVRFLGFVSDEDKNKLYQAAKLFIYPSLYEGFGLPVLEAMENKTVVACSNTSSLPEVVGEAAYTFDPEDLGEISEALLKMTSLKDQEYEEYMDSCKKQLEKFSWDKCAIEIENTIKEVKNYD
ncbi:glycosyltransferase family 4 protein [Clostridium gasigenes]|uniref:glycosyltransferase family 4 protein n=1 Tax=Clostridium gasigenes TaxID=94869 RepID=UPI001C0C831E|nr:glycosyltransferase family 4 protein [Clostridium gasigenes]